jgi:hypothetical protein
MKRANGMPRVDVENLPLDDADRAIVRRIMNGDRMRASAPPTKPCTVESGLAYYVWRMAAFSVSPNPQHHCMPCTADFYFPREYSWGTDARKAIVARGDRIEKAVVHSIPVSEWHGIRRWGNAFGSIGTPQVAPDGSIIYR